MYEFYTMVVVTLNLVALSVFLSFKIQLKYSEFKTEVKNELLKEFRQQTMEEIKILNSRINEEYRLRLEREKADEENYERMKKDTQGNE